MHAPIFSSGSALLEKYFEYEWYPLSDKITEGNYPYPLAFRFRDAAHWAIIGYCPFKLRSTIGLGINMIGW